MTVIWTALATTVIPPTASIGHTTHSRRAFTSTPPSVIGADLAPAGGLGRHESELGGA